MNRRTYVKQNRRAGMALSTFPTILTGSSWKGANDRVNVAQIGIHGFGQHHIGQYQALENVEVAAICDVDTNLFAGSDQKALYR